MYFIRIYLFFMHNTALWIGYLGTSSVHFLDIYEVIYLIQFQITEEEININNLIFIAKLYFSLTL